MLPRILIGSLVLLAACGDTAPKGAPAKAPPPSAPTRARGEVTGRATGHDGAPARLAHARVLDLAGTKVTEVELGSDGSFALPLDGIDAELAWLEVTAVDHRSQRLLVPTAASTVLEVRLGTHARSATPAPTLVLHRHDGKPGDVPMQRSVDGTWAADVDAPDGPLAYQVAGVMADRTVNGTAAERYEYDGGGDYRSVVTVTGGKARVVLDLARLPPAALPPTITFTPPTSVAAQLAQLEALIAEGTAAFEVHLRGLQDGKASGVVIGQATLAAIWQPLYARLAPLTASPEPLVQRAAWLRWLAASQLGERSAEERAAAVRLLRELPPPDPSWRLDERTFAAIAAIAGDAAAAEVKAFVAHSPDAGSVAWYLVEEMQRGQQEPAKVATLRAQLKDPRFASTSAARVAAMMVPDPERAAAPGKAMPAFAVPGLRGAQLDAAAPHTLGDYAGKVVLVEFWATWCAPCVADLPALHALHARFARRGLRVLSISLDDDPATVAAFRTSGQPMPWDHAVIPPSSPLMTSLFGGQAIPAFALVGADGVVLASSPGDRAEDLANVLEGVLPEA